MNPLVQTILCYASLTLYKKEKSQLDNKIPIYKNGKSQNECGTMGGLLNARFSLLLT